MKKETEAVPPLPPDPGETTVTEPTPEMTAVAGLLAELRAENAHLAAAIREGRAREQITDALRKAGARSPGLLFEAARGDLQFTEDGNLSNAAALVKRLGEHYPEQFADPGPASIDGGAGRAAHPPLTREALAKMTPAEIARLDWSAVKQVLSEK